MPGNHQIFIRGAAITDLSCLRQLFRDAILAIGMDDYTEAQLQAWASVWENEERWMNKFNHQQFFIAEIENNIVGFASLTSDGYLDFLYVHKDFHRRGIAGKLLERVELQARQNALKLLSTDASFTACLFFKKHGFSEVKRQTVSVNGVLMDNYAMQKILT